VKGTITKWILAVAIVFVSSPLSTAKERGVELITNVHVSSQVIKGIKVEPVTISFGLVQGIDPTSCLIHTVDGYFIKKLVTKKQDGKYQCTWDSSDNSGKLAGNGAYKYSIESQKMNGKEIVLWDISSETRGREVGVDLKLFDRKRGVIKFGIPNNAWVSILLGVRDGPLIRHVLDGELLLRGEHELIWDGKDDSGLLSYLGNDKLQASLTAISLPANAIVITGRDYDQHVAESLPINFTFVPGNVLHSQHHRSLCHAPQVQVIVPMENLHGYTWDAVPKISGRVPIRIEFLEDEVVALRNQYYEVVYYIDGQYIFEDERTFMPTTYHLDTSGVATGYHFILINVAEKWGHIAETGMRVFIER